MPATVPKPSPQQLPPHANRPRSALCQRTASPRPSSPTPTPNSASPTSTAPPDQTASTAPASPCAPTEPQASPSPAYPTPNIGGAPESRQAKNNLATSS